ncbi:unnamed protein product [Caenorhabditis brenneri]
MTTFPLLSLPMLAVKEIVRQVDPDSTLELTIVSRPFRRAVQFFKLNATSIKWTFNHSKTEIQLVFSGMSESICFKSSDENKTEELTKHLLRIIRPRVAHLECDLGPDTSIRNLFIWKYSVTFGQVAVNSSLQEPKCLSPEELKFLLEDVITHNLVLNVKVNKFAYQGVIKKDYIKIKNSSWLNNTVLMRMDSKYVKIEEYSDPGIKYDKLIENWISGGNNSLEHFYAVFKRSLSMDPGAITRKIPCKQSIFSMRDLANRNVQLMQGMQPMVDIRRESDNLLATVIIEERSFHLVVWHKHQIKWCTRETRNKLKEHESYEMLLKKSYHSLKNQI